MRLSLSQRLRLGPQRPKSPDIVSPPPTGPLSWRTYEVKAEQQPQEGPTSPSPSEEKTQTTDSETSSMHSTGPLAWRAQEIEEPRTSLWKRIKKAFAQQEDQEPTPEKPSSPGEILNKRLNQYYEALAKKYPDAEEQLEQGARRLRLRVNQNTELTLLKSASSPGIMATIRLKDRSTSGQEETETISIISLPNNVRIDSALVKNGELNQEEDDTEDRYGNKQKHNTYMSKLNLKERYQRGLGILRMVVRGALKHPENVAKLLPGKKMVSSTTKHAPNQPPMAEIAKKPQAKIPPELLKEYANLAAQVLPHKESFVDPARPSPQTLGDRELPDITITISRQRPNEQGYIIVDEYTDKKGITRLLQVRTDAQGNIIEAQARELNKNLGFEELPKKAFPILAEYFTRRIKQVSLNYQNKIQQLHNESLLA